MRVFRKCFYKDFGVFSDALCILHPSSYDRTRRGNRRCSAETMLHFKNKSADEQNIIFKIIDKSKYLW